MKAEQLFKPINLLLANLSLTKKFTLVVCVSLIGYIPGAYFIYTSLHDSKIVVYEEIAGVDFFLKAYQPFYDLNQAYLKGTAQEARSLTDAAKEGLQDLNTLNTENAHYFQSSAEYDVMLNTLESSTNAQDHAAFKASVTNLVQQFTNLFDNVVSKSGLALDPELESYYVMDTANIKLEKLLVSYTKFAALQINSDLTPPQIDKSEQLILANQIQNTANDISNSLKRINENGTALSQYTEKMRTILAQISDNTTKDINAIKSGLKTDTNYQANIESIHTATIESTNELKQLLDSRLSRLSSSSLKTWSAVFFCLFIMLYIVFGFIYSLKYSISTLVESIRLISTGNLVSEIPDIGRDELNSVLQNMSTMQDGLSAIIEEISEVSGTLNSSAHEISSGNNTLSERTQEQASCLVETSASLNNLTQTIKKNAVSANEAEQLATTATDFAQKGGNAVNEVIATMAEINDSAKKIQEITSVIDGIAFQTNLLALNASVEAARAGEQGRGFAVVASEVRNLAQRSADAAKQIKGLINDSMTKVASGDTQVKLTWSTMQDIVKSIENVNTLVGKISVESNEQSLSIEQINIVISQLEGNTQKNAAQVEEVAASAELLREQSTKLVGIVGKFDTQPRDVTRHKENTTPNVKSKSSVKPANKSKKEETKAQQPIVSPRSPKTIPIEDTEWQEF